MTRGACFYFASLIVVKFTISRWGGAGLSGAETVECKQWRKKCELPGSDGRVMSGISNPDDGGQLLALNF